MGHESEGGRESSFKSGTRPASLQAEMRQRLCCRGLSSLALVVALIGLAASDTVECSRPEAGGERVVGVAHVIERNGSQSNSTTPSSERPDDDFEKFCRFIKETTETTLNSRANQTLRELMGGQVERRRGFELELSILSKQALSERIEADRMNVSYEGEFDKGRETRLVIMHNDTTILVARIYTKYYYWKVGQTVGAVIIFCMIVAGNLSILHRLKSCRRRRSNVNYFIVQLAIADLFVGLFNVTLDLFFRLKKVFVYGALACRASKYISVLFIYSSTYLLVALSIDRWEAVVKPLAFTKNRGRGYHLVAGAWLLAIISAAPVTLRTNIKEIEGLPQCWVDLDLLGWKLYMIYITCTVLIIPALIIAVCYIHIVYTIWSKGQTVVGQQQRQQKHQHQHQRQQRKKVPQLQQEQGQNLDGLTQKVNNRQMEQIRSARSHSEAGDSTSLSSGSSLSSLSSASSDRARVRRQGAGLTCPSLHEASTERDKEDQVNEIAPKEEIVDIVQGTEEDYVSTDEERAGYSGGISKVISSKQTNENGQTNEELANEAARASEPPVKSSNDRSRQFSPASVKASSFRRSGGVKLNLARISNYQESHILESGKTKSNRNMVTQQHGSGVIPAARIKTVKMTLVIVAVYILCWSPFCIINLCSVFGLMKNDTTISIALMTLTQSLAHLNSAVNPIIFWMFSSKRNNPKPIPTTSSDAHSARNRELAEKPNIWRIVKRLIACKCCFADKGWLASTDSRMFESTGTSALQSGKFGSVSLRETRISVRSQVRHQQLAAPDGADRSRRQTLHRQGTVC